MLTLLTKEIKENISTLKYLITSILCVILIPLSLYISLKDYEGRLNSYHKSKNFYIEQSRGQIGPTLEAKGFYPPSILSTFSYGFKDYLPFQVTIYRNKEHVIEKRINDENNLFPILFGRIDFVFIVTTVLSLIVVVSTFSSISGEKEKGTLKLMLVNPIPRWKIIVSKILGHYIMFLVPFLISIIIGLFIIGNSTIFNLYFGHIIIIVLASMLLIFTFFNISIFVSTIVSNSLTSIIVLLFIWILFALFIPRTSPLIAQLISPIQSKEAYQTERQIIKEELDKDFTRKKSELFARIMASNGIELNEHFDFYDPKLDETRATYDNQVIKLEDVYNIKLKTSLNSIDQSYFKKQEKQFVITKNIARISPICNYTYVLSEICNTGYSEILNFNKYSSIYSNEVKKNIYDKWERQTYTILNKNGNFTTDGYVVKGDYRSFDPQKILIPNFQYKNQSLSEIFENIWIEFLILVFISICFFTLAFVSFLRYDIR